MALKLMLDKAEFDTLDSTTKTFYEEKDGKFCLGVEDAVPKQKLNEFRDNNTKLLKELDEFKKKYGNVDVDEYTKMKTEYQKMQDKKLLDAGQIDELINQRTERMRADHTSQIEGFQNMIKSEKEKAEALRGKLEAILIDAEITKAVASVGRVRPGAMQDILARGKSIWRLEEDQPVARTGDKILYSKDGSKPLTIAEWAKEILPIEAAHCFEGSSGSGASTTKMANGSDLSKVTDPTERLRLLRMGK